MVFARAHSNFVWRVLSGELNRDSPDLPLPAPAVYLWPLFPNKALALSRSLSLSLALFGPQRLAPVLRLFQDRVVNGLLCTLFGHVSPCVHIVALGRIA